MTLVLLAPVAVPAALSAVHGVAELRALRRNTTRGPTQAAVTPAPAHTLVGTPTAGGASARPPAPTQTATAAAPAEAVASAAPTKAITAAAPTETATATAPTETATAATPPEAAPRHAAPLQAAIPAQPNGRPAATGARVWRGGSAWVALVSPGAILGGALAVVPRVLGGGSVEAAGGLLRIDALGVWMLLVTGAVAALAVAAGPAYLAGERAAGRADDRTARRYHLLVHAFLAAMCLAVLAANLGVLWVAMEATTVVTAFLVGHRRTRPSVEAAWKYVVICSAGIALAFLGTVLLYYAARQAGIPERYALDWRYLAAHAGALDPEVTRLAAALAVLGFGAKAGLVPLHAWLPDAHSQAPPPVSALMSGVLLAVSFTALLRYRAIADAALGPGFVRLLLTLVALLTLALAAGLLLGQREYERMLAYSSMEHMSLVALGTAVGGQLALAAVLLHVAGHGLAKAVAFCASGEVHRLRRTPYVGRIRGLAGQAPALAAAFGLAALALGGLPPFSLFASELGIVRAAFRNGMGCWAALALALLTTSYAAIATRVGRMLLGTRPGPPGTTRLGLRAGVPLFAGLVACAGLGVAGGGAVAQVLASAAGAG